MACGAAGPSPQERDAVTAARGGLGTRARWPGRRPAARSAGEAWSRFTLHYFGAAPWQNQSPGGGRNRKGGRNKPKDLFLNLPPSPFPND